MDIEAAYVRLGLDEQHLLWERTVLVESLADATADSVGALEGQPGDLGDAAAAVVERDQDIGLVESIDRALEEIAAARRRIEAGAFGRCEACGRQIEDERLEALPATRFCVNDARLHERLLGGADR
jgi:RNA polymerase-binding transcription factor DksA